MDIDPDKIIAALLTGLIVKAGEKGYAYLKRVWTSRRSAAASRKKSSIVAPLKQLAF